VRSPKDFHATESYNSSQHVFSSSSQCQFEYPLPINTDDDDDDDDDDVDDDECVFCGDFSRHLRGAEGPTHTEQKVGSL
jgi:hypothetical protein